MDMGVQKFLKGPEPWNSALGNTGGRSGSMAYNPIIPGLGSSNTRAGAESARRLSHWHAGIPGRCNRCRTEILCTIGRAAPGVIVLRSKA
jgi:hypothetical protein